MLYMHDDVQRSSDRRYGSQIFMFEWNDGVLRSPRHTEKNCSVFFQR